MIHISVFSTEEQDLNTILSMLSTQEDFEIASRGRCGFDAIISADTYHPDIIIMDLWMSDSKGIDIAPIIRRKSPETKIMVLCSINDAGWIKPAMRAGITGIFIRQSDMDNLDKAVRTVCNEGFYLSKPLMQYAYLYLSTIDSLISAELLPITFLAEDTDPPISETERIIISYMVIGYSDKEIADELSIAIGTVRNCFAAIKRKTGQKNRAQMVIYSLMHGLIGFPLKK